MVTPSTSGSSIDYFGAVPNQFYSANTENGYTARTDVFQVTSMNSDKIDYTNRLNDAWYYAMFDNLGGYQYTGSSFYTYVSDLELTSSLSNCASFYDYYVNGNVLTLNNLVDDNSDWYTQTFGLNSSIIKKKRYGVANLKSQLKKVLMSMIKEYEKIVRHARAGTYTSNIESVRKQQSINVNDEFYSPAVKIRNRYYKKHGKYTESYRYD